MKASSVVLLLRHKIIKPLTKIYTDATNSTIQVNTASGLKALTLSKEYLTVQEGMEFELCDGGQYNGNGYLLQCIFLQESQMRRVLLLAG